MTKLLDEKIYVRLTAEEKARLTKYAEERGFVTAQFVRFIIRKKLDELEKATQENE